MQKQSNPSVIRFWSLVNKSGPTVPGMSGPCWIWQGYKNKRGYGRTTTNGRHQYVHRYAYSVAKGPIPEGLHIDHMCFTPLCVNPEHLDAVTPAENNRRSAAAGRLIQTHCKRGHPLRGPGANVRAHKNGTLTCRPCSNERYRERVGPTPPALRGSQNGWAKLDEARVRAILIRLAAGHLGKHIARDFDVSDATISAIKLRQRWSHVTIDNKEVTE